MKFKGRLTYRNFLDYFSNKLRKKEKQAFEKRIMQDSFESEAFDGLSKLKPKEFEKDMADLGRRIQNLTQDKKKRISIWMPYAASVAILLGLGSILIFLNQYSAQDEMIVAQLDKTVKRIEGPIIEPEISKQVSESIDIKGVIETDTSEDISVKIEQYTYGRSSPLNVNKENANHFKQYKRFISGRQVDPNNRIRYSSGFTGSIRGDVTTQTDSSFMVGFKMDERNMNEVVGAIGNNSNRHNNKVFGAIGYNSIGENTERAKPINYQSISKFKTHLIEDLNYTKLEHLHGVYKLKFSFVVDPSGSISKIVFKGDTDSILAAEIEDMIRNGGKLQAEKSGGVSVSSEVKIVLRIKFK